METRSSRDFYCWACSWSWSIMMPALICLWPRLHHLVLHFEGLVWTRGFPLTSLASSESLMLPEAQRIFHSFVVHSDAPTRTDTGCLGDYPVTKNTVSLEQRYMIIYHWLHDLSHSSKYSVGSFVKCNVITCYNTEWENCVL
jgi:hypothetical protein